MSRLSEHVRRVPVGATRKHGVEVTLIDVAPLVPMETRAR